MNLYDVLVRYKNGEHPRAQKLPMRLAAEETPELSSVAAYTKQKNDVRKNRDTARTTT